MNETEMKELLAMCRNLGAVVEYHPEYGYFTAMVFENGRQPEHEARALSIQKQIQQRIAQYPELVCYCFDAFSTLVYKV